MKWRRIAFDGGAHQAKWLRDALHWSFGEGGITNHGHIEISTGDEAAHQAHGGAAVATIEMIGRLGPLGGRANSNGRLIEPFEGQSHLSETGESGFAVFSPEWVLYQRIPFGNGGKHVGPVSERLIARGSHGAAQSFDGVDGEGQDCFSFAARASSKNCHTP